MNILDALQTILGLGGPTWRAWCALIGGAFGCPLTADMAATFRTLTNREPLAQPCRELWFAVGRRGGKNRAAAAGAVYLALFKQWTLAAGEVGVVMVLANDRTQARVAFRYVLGLLQSDPVLAQEIASVTADTITLRNGSEITIVTADGAAVRGRTIVAAILDEFAFWPYDEAQEVLRALRPGMATQPASVLVIISSVYAASGPFYEARRAYFGTDDPRIVYAVATSRDMNPTLTGAFIESELERDPTGNAAEYLSIERSDVASFLDAPLVDGNTRTEPRELPALPTTPTGGPIRYHAGLDVSGGRGDAAAAAVAHREGDRAVVDCVRIWKAPHDPQQVAQEVAALLVSYRLGSATADRYAAGFSRSVYAAVGIALVDAPVTCSESFLHLLPQLASGRVELPPHPQLRQELLALERRTRPGGRDVVGHRPGGHDDAAAAVALAVHAATRVRTATGLQLAYGTSQFFDGYHREVARPYVHPADREHASLRDRLDYDLS